jgi:sugar/nucleoside kinase (ribokinase family)
VTGTEGRGVRGGPGFDGWADGRKGGRAQGRNDEAPSATLRSALVAAPAVEALDPTGCGDVFGAAAAARLFAGDPVEEAIRHATAMAARNAGFRGAGGLVHHLRGDLVTP